MPDTAALLDRFQQQIDSAVAYAAKRSSLDREDLRMYAVERVLVYSTGEGWDGRRKLTAAAGAEVNRKVRRALNCDLLNHVRDDAKQRGETVSVDQVIDSQQEIRFGLVYEISGTTDNEAQIDYLEKRWPLLMMHYHQGLTLREMAAELGWSYGMVQRKMTLEREGFISHYGTAELLEAA